VEQRRELAASYGGRGLTQPELCKPAKIGLATLSLRVRFLVESGSGQIFHTLSSHSEEKHRPKHAKGV
jgi:hypothetical protein